MVAYEVSVSKLAACESAENFDLEEEFSFLSPEISESYQTIKNV